MIGKSSTFAHRNLQIPYAKVLFLAPGGPKGAKIGAKRVVFFAFSANRAFLVMGRGPPGGGCPRGFLAIAQSRYAGLFSY